MSTLQAHAPRQIVGPIASLRGYRPVPRKPRPASSWPGWTDQVSFTLADDHDDAPEDCEPPDADDDPLDLGINRGPFLATRMWHDLPRHRPTYGDLTDPRDEVRVIEEALEEIADVMRDFDLKDKSFDVPDLCDAIEFCCVWLRWLYARS